MAHVTSFEEPDKGVRNMRVSTFGEYQWKCTVLFSVGDDSVALHLHSLDSARRLHDLIGQALQDADPKTELQAARAEGTDPFAPRA